MRAQPLYPDRPAGNKIRIGQVFFQDDMDHGQRQGGIRTGAYRKPHPASSCGLGFPWIHAYSVAAFSQGFLDRKRQFAVRAGDNRVMPPEQDRFRIHRTRIIRVHETTVCQPAHRNPRKKTVGQSGLKPVGGAQSVGEPDHMHKMVPACPLPDGDGFRACFFSGLTQTFGDLIQGLFPADFLPTSLPTIPDPFQRHPESSRVNHNFRTGQPLDTHLAPVEQGTGDRTNPGQITVPYMKIGHASAVANAAYTPKNRLLFRHGQWAPFRYAVPGNVMQPLIRRPEIPAVFASRSFRRMFSEFRNETRSPAALWIWPNVVHSISVHPVCRRTLPFEPR